MAARVTSAARPKRAAEDFARTHESSKKPRFDHRNPSTLVADAPEEDLVLEADVIGRSGAQTKRNAVNIDGYESDSDNDNFNARAAEKERKMKADANGKGSKDEDDDDMFADLEPPDGDEDEELAAEGKGKKEVRFLEESEIEGQVLNSRSGGHVSSTLLVSQPGKGRATAGNQDSDSDSSGEDEERAQLPDEMDDDEDAVEIGAGGKKRHAPRLDAFNLKQESEEGRFDETGNYIRKAVDPDAVNDNWLEGVSKKEMKKAREAAERREDEQRQKAIEEDAVLTSDLLDTLIQNLEIGETPLEALARLNKSKPKETKVPRWKQKKKSKDQMDIDQPPTSDRVHVLEKVETVRRKAVDDITGAADALYTRGQHNIYETERELLMRQYTRETHETWKAPATKAGPGALLEQNMMFEYKWSDARDGGSIHGPYDRATMKSWQEAGYFGEGVEFRQAGENEWSRLLEID